MEGTITSRFQLVFQFVIFPVLVVAVCVGVFLIFGWISYEPKGLSDYLLDMRTGGPTRRWHAAFELSKKLANQQAAANASRTTSSGQGDPGFVRSLLDLLKQSEHDDPRLRQYLILCLGYLHGPGVLDELTLALADKDPMVRLYAVWSLALQRHGPSVPRLLDMLKGEDAPLRKGIVYALGAIGDARALPALKEYLNDPVTDVQWNCALALARFGDATGAPKILKMLDRAYLDTMPAISERQKEQVMINAIKGAALLHTSELRNRLEELSQTDSDVKVRQAAMEGLKESH